MFAGPHPPTPDRTPGIARPKQGAAHRCLPCLRSADPRRQACALGHLRAEGQRIDALKACPADRTPQQ